MDVSSYSELLTAARAQATPQRQLFAFAAAQLPGDASAEQRQSCAQQHGGAFDPGGRRCSIGRGGVEKDADSDKPGSGGRAFRLQPEW